METNWYRIAMQNMKPIFCSAWILPDGMVVDTGIEGHEYYVMQNPSKFGIADDEYDIMVRGEFAYSLAFKHGAVRISRHDKTLGVEGNAYSVKRFKDKIYDMAISFGSKEIQLQLGSVFRTVPVGELHENI